MKLIYKGGFDGNVENLPGREHMPGATKFKEFDDPTKLAIFMNVIAVIVGLGLVAFVALYGEYSPWMPLGAIMSMVILFPHEILHAICFKETVYLYTNWTKGMLFVVGPETMSKGRFIFMSLLPNIVFGFIPFIIFLFMPQWSALGMFGGLSISMGVGDFYNVFNALTQMPKGARTYLHKFNSYWYIPDKK